MPQRPLAFLAFDRCVPGGLAAWFDRHDTMSVRRLPEAFAQTNLLDDQPIGIILEPGTLRRWKAFAQATQQEQQP